jgi:hypothetical protein
MIDSNQLVQALGLHHTHDAVKGMLQALGLADKKIKLKRGDFDVGFQSEANGVDVVFSDPELHTVSEDFPDGGLIFSCVFFFSEGCQGHRAFVGPLPSGLEFGLSRATVRERLGPPDWTSPLLPIDRWNIGNLRLSVNFHEGDAAISYLSVGLPKV